MTRSVLRLARNEKHDRLFELIRQGRLVETREAHASQGLSSEQSRAQMQALRDQAVRSIQS